MAQTIIYAANKDASVGPSHCTLGPKLSISFGPMVKRQTGLPPTESALPVGAISDGLAGLGGGAPSDFRSTRK
jgi:hypothetical protein